MARKLLYKYQAGTDKHVASLLNRQMFFSDKNSVNDPLDCMPTIDWGSERKFMAMGRYEFNQKLSGLTDDARALLCNERVMRTLFNTYANPENFGKFLSHHSESIGLLSLSGTPSNSLMWSHYAQGHRGYCVGLEFDYIEDLMFSSCGAFEGCESWLLKVNYEDEVIPFMESFYALLSWYIETTARRKGSDLTDEEVIKVLSFKSYGGIFFNHFASVYYSQKMPYWRYENEYRAIALPNGKASTGLKRLTEESSIKEVIFGCRSTEKLRSVIMEGLAGFNVQFYMAELDSTDSSSLSKRKLHF